MQSIDDFKSFVRTMPSLKDEVLGGKYTWQQLYELYDLYGEDHEIWEDYKKEIKKETGPVSSGSSFDLNTILKYVQNIDMDKASQALTQLNKVITLGSSLLKKEEPVRGINSKPTYRRFDD